MTTAFYVERAGTRRLRRGRSQSLTLQRSIDLLLVIVGIVALIPVMAIIAAVIWAADGGPPIYGHTRVGWKGRLFSCWKFRTMVQNSQQALDELLERDAAAKAEWLSTQKLKNDPRVTSVGQFLRRTSLDELPQLWNVLTGEMSVVGPRPIVVSEVAHYGGRFSDYCTCRPGITGLWQVSGRSDVSYERRVELDTTYANTRTVLMDLGIIASTIPAVIARRGSY